MALKEMPKVGEKVRYIGGHRSFITVGKEYVVLGIEGDYFDIKDDDGDILGYGHQDFPLFELITESSEAPQPDVHALIANIGRRLHEVETAIAPRVCAEVGPADTLPDAVNPDHYKRGKYETIDIIEHITSGYDDPFVAYCVGSTVKYVDRAPYKHVSPAECLRKAAWYLTRAADHIEASE